MVALSGAFRLWLSVLLLLLWLLDELDVGGIDVLDALLGLNIDGFIGGGYIALLRGTVLGTGARARSLLGWASSIHLVGVILEVDGLVCLDKLSQFLVEVSDWAVVTDECLRVLRLWGWTGRYLGACSVIAAETFRLGSCWRKRCLG